MSMTKRLQVLLPDEELAEIQQLARRRRQTTAAWVRDALRVARDTASYPETGRKLHAVREAVSHAYPASEIEGCSRDRARVPRGRPRVIFVDSNIPMYLVGADHPNKETARRLLERAITDGELLVTDAEVLQEILHRYVAIDRRDAIEPATAALLGVVDEVFPVERADVERAAADRPRNEAVGPRRGSPRDHAAPRHRPDHDVRPRLRRGRRDLARRRVALRATSGARRGGPARRPTRRASGRGEREALHDRRGGGQQARPSGCRRRRRRRRPPSRRPARPGGRAGGARCRRRPSGGCRSRRRRAAPWEPRWRRGRTRSSPC